MTGKVRRGLDLVLVVADGQQAADPDATDLARAGRHRAAVVGDHDGASPSANLAVPVDRALGRQAGPCPSASELPSESTRSTCGRWSSSRSLTGWLHITPDETISAQARQVPAPGVGVQRLEQRAGEGVAHDDQNGDPLRLRPARSLGVEGPAGQRHHRAAQREQAERRSSGPCRASAGRRQQHRRGACGGRDVGRGCASMVASSSSGTGEVALDQPRPESSCRHITPLGTPVVPPV